MPLKKNDFPGYTSATNNINVTGPGVWASYAAAGATMILPPSSAIRGTDLALYVLEVASSGGPVTVSRSAADTILVGGVATATSFVLMPGESVTMVYTGISWVPLFAAPNPASYRRVKTASAATTLDRSGSMWTFTGTVAATWTLPALANNTGLEYLVKNKGTVDLTIQRAGTDQLYTTTAVNTITITPGSSARIVNDGVHWAVL